MFGSHLSISGSMVNALAQARRLKLDTVQVFTKNQQQWKVKPLDDGVVREWTAELRTLGWQDRTVSHASYLINLASGNDELWAKSVDLMTVEVERCEQLSIPLLVHHPGSFVGSTLEDGIARIARAYGQLFRRTKGFRTVLCLEGTAGAGSHIGGAFEHLRDLRSAIASANCDPARVAFCLDSCHLHAAGHDMSTADAARRTLAEFDAMCGIQHVRVWHLNDSKGALGSHLDRHDHIGLGFVGGGKTDPRKAGKFAPRKLRSSGFAAIVQDPRFHAVPKILETPKEPDATIKRVPLGRRLDAINIRRLRSLLDQ